MIICIDPGHGGKDPGAIFHTSKEKDIALTVSKMLAQELRERGHEVVMTRDNDRALSLAGRCSTANQAKADVFVSIHLNADADADETDVKEARGYEILHAGSSKGIRLAAAIDSNLMEQDAIRSRGLKFRDNLYVLNATKMPAVLVELGFIDSRQERLLLEDPLIQRRMAKLIAEGICDAAL